MPVPSSERNCVLQAADVTLASQGCSGIDSVEEDGLDTVHRGQPVEQDAPLFAAVTTEQDLAALGATIDTGAGKGVGAQSMAQDIDPRILLG